MEKIFQEYLFQKHFFVAEEAAKEAAQEGKDEGRGAAYAFECLFSLANLFGISITEGREHADEDMIRLASDMLGQNIPAPFYLGFPETVKKLTPDELLFDQMVHYAVTYGFGNFTNPGHSLLEEDFKRIAFKEEVEVKEFQIISEEEAVARLAGYAEGLLASSRPINDQQFELICAYVSQYHYQVTACASKNTAVRLLVRTRDLQFAEFLSLSDVIKVLDEINFTVYHNENVKKLNLHNQDRKLLIRVIDNAFARGRYDLKTCYEKKAVWCGLLHHLHYQPKLPQAKEFVKCMRSKGNESVYSGFEKALAEGDVRGAVKTLKDGKGSGALLRNLDYVVSRVSRPEDLNYVLENLDTKNNLILLQLYLHYSMLMDAGVMPRSFRFVRHGIMKVRQETEKDVKRRKSMISRGQAMAIAGYVEENLRRNLKGKLGKVYVDEGMKKIALPLQEATSQGGFGVLSKGSRLSIPEGKKIRAFTYWEKVNDIDLSVIGLDENDHQREFSWRTMANNQSNAITFSGDETSGYHGGSEFFDVDLEEFRQLYPNIRYLVFCNNVFSGVNFEKCYCTAGYMMRDKLDSGEIFEPKTVQTSFLINCPSMFAYLFGIELETREFVWLNVMSGGEIIVAGATNLGFLKQYLNVTKIMNVHRFFEMAATELVTDPAQADVIVSDRPEDWKLANSVPNDEKAAESMPEKQCIRSFDFEKLFALMN